MSQPSPRFNFQKDDTWQCPFCQAYSSIRQQDYFDLELDLTPISGEGHRTFGIFYVRCPNKVCKKFSLTARLLSFSYEKQPDGASVRTSGGTLHTWNLVPASKAKAFPDYIPAVIISDYQEACSIVKLSPKASATLCRRCLQGMIRDHFGVRKGRLIDEINAIEDKLDPLVWQSIDTVRHMGNIGAHMEKDINQIVDVDEGEAETLIELIELLLREWYILQYERKKKLEDIIKLKNK